MNNAYLNAVRGLVGDETRVITTKTSFRFVLRYSKDAEEYDFPYVPWTWTEIDERGDAVDTWWQWSIEAMFEHL